MKHILTIFCMLLAFVGSLHADDLLVVDTLEIDVGNHGNLNFMLQNTTADLTAYQMRLILPEGLELQKDEEGNYIYMLSTRHNEATHALTIFQKNDGSYLLICYSDNNSTIGTTSSATLLFSLSVSASESLKDKKGQLLLGKVSDIVFSNTSGDKIKLENAETVFSIDYPIIIIDHQTREYGEENPILTYTVEGAAVLNGELELFTEATLTSQVGDYTIKANTGTINAYYEVVEGTLTVTKAPLIIAVNSVSKLQGDPIPTFEITYSGFKNNETETVLTKQPTLTCEATVASPPGEYPITLSGADAQNYEITYVNGTLTVTDADAVVVTAISYSREYGEENPDFGFTSTGAELEGSPSISCEATATSPVGEYPIVITKGNVTNYNDHYVNGTLTVTKAPLVIAVNPATRKQGEENPLFTLSYSGFKNGETAETEGVFTKRPIITCEATAASEPGQYLIKVDGAEAQNYEISYVTGSLTVLDADEVVVTAENKSREYGEENPELTYTCEGAELEGSPSLTCDATAASPVGTYDIVISKGSITNYNDHYVNGTLTVTKAPLVITVNPVTRKQGEENPEFTLTYSGFKNGETAETEGVFTKLPIITCEATAASEPGNYFINVDGAEAQNYEISYVTNSLTVMDADSVTFTARDYTVEYGEPQPTFGYDYTTEGEEQSGEPVIACEAVQGSPVGTYPILISKGDVKNYNDHYFNGTLTITPAPLTVSVAGEYSRYEGEENPDFLLSYSGWKMEDDERVLTSKPMVVCEADVLSPAGEYPIMVMGGEAQNYTLLYIGGVLTVLAREVTDSVNVTIEAEGAGRIRVGETEVEDEVLTVRVPKGRHTVLEVLPDEGYRLAKLTVGDRDVTDAVSENRYVIPSIEQDTMVYAVFMEDIEWFVVDGIRYGVTDLAAGEVKVIAGDYVGSLTIPSQVSHADRVWTVTGLDARALRGCPWLVSVSVPLTVTAVGQDLFKKDRRLAAIRWEALVKMTQQVMGDFTNPNMLLYMKDAACAPDGAQNIIVDGVAERIVLTDVTGDGNCDYYCPEAFTARHISYQHAYTQATRIDVRGGWETLALPFDVHEVSHERQGSIQPFAALKEEDIEAGAKPFWLYTCTDADTYEHTADIKAYTPYIIAMPNDPAYEEEYILSGFVTFSSENIEVPRTPDSDDLAVGRQKYFIPNFSRQPNGQNLFCINSYQTYAAKPEGSIFVRNLRDLRPFESYFRYPAGAAVKEWFGVLEEITDGICEMMNEKLRIKNGSGAVYDLSGRRIAERQLSLGIYIQSGKKVIKR